MSTENQDKWPSLTANKDREAPFGWIQWKGTNVCMDVHCLCGRLLHIDSDFTYYIKCAYCKRVYECSGYIDLHPLDFEPDTTHLIGEDDPEYATDIAEAAADAVVEAAVEKLSRLFAAPPSTPEQEQMTSLVEAKADEVLDHLRAGRTVQLMAHGEPMGPPITPDSITRNPGVS